MSLGKIIEAKGDGLYVVELLPDILRVQERKAHFTGLISDLEPAIATKYTELSGATDLSERRAIETAIAELKIRKASAEKQLDFYTNAVPDDPPRVIVWCADYTDDLTAGALVAVADIAGERRRINVRPGYEDAAAYMRDRDGLMQPAISGTPANVWVNYCLFPAWQKWLPRYRYGKITAIDYAADTCDLTLEPETSWAQGINVNQSETLSAVPVRYMSCNAAAFEVGDAVLIEFPNLDWNAPQVIGFKSHPEQCDFYIKVTVNNEAPQTTDTIQFQSESGFHGPAISIPADGVMGPFSYGDYPNEVWIFHSRFDRHPVAVFTAETVPVEVDGVVVSAYAFNWVVPMLLVGLEIGLYRVEVVWDQVDEVMPTTMDGYIFPLTVWSHVQATRDDWHEYRANVLGVSYTGADPNRLWTMTACGGTTAFSPCVDFSEPCGCGYDCINTHSDSCSSSYQDCDGVDRLDTRSSEWVTDFQLHPECKSLTPRNGYVYADNPPLLGLRQQYREGGGSTSWDCDGIKIGESSSETVTETHVCPFGNFSENTRQLTDSVAVSGLWPDVSGQGTVTTTNIVQVYVLQGADLQTAAQTVEVQAAWQYELSVVGVKPASSPVRASAFETALEGIIRDVINYPDQDFYGYATAPSIPGIIDELRLFSTESMTLSAEQAAFFALINDHREGLGLIRLRHNYSLYVAAERHAQDMAENLLMADHIGSDGSTPTERMQEAGYCLGYTTACLTYENNAYWSEDTWTPEIIFQAWLDSLEHRATIENPAFRELSISSALGSDNIRRWCSTFGYNDAHEA